MFELLDFAHKISHFAIAGEGNVSSRTLDNNFYIKSSGTDLHTLCQEDLTLCDIDGNQLNPSHKKPSIETLFHSWIFKNFPEINFIAHTHPTNTVKILCSKQIYKFANSRLFPDQVVRNGAKSCIVPYATPGKSLLDVVALHVYQFVDKQKYFPKLILLQNHGIIAASSSAKSCIDSSLVCEKSAEIFIGSKILGEVNFLTKEQIREIDNCPNENYRRTI